MTQFDKDTFKKATENLEAAKALYNEAFNAAVKYAVNRVKEAKGEILSTSKLAEEVGLTPSIMGKALTEYNLCRGSYREVVTYYKVTEDGQVDWNSKKDIVTNKSGYWTY